MNETKHDRRRRLGLFTKQEVCDLAGCSTGMLPISLPQRPDRTASQTGELELLLHQGAGRADCRALSQSAAVGKVPQTGQARWPWHIRDFVAVKR